MSEVQPGTRIYSFSELFELEQTTLLVGESGESYRVVNHFGEKRVLTHSPTGTLTSTLDIGDADMTKTFGTDGKYSLTVVYVP